ncbi:MAG: hypothetical protein WCI17_00795 [bacterium]
MKVAGVPQPVTQTTVLPYLEGAAPSVPGMLRITVKKPKSLVKENKGVYLFFAKPVKKDRFSSGNILSNRSLR